ncbi:hypothetical protein D1872_264660 [compost metagenome]
MSDETIQRLLNSQTVEQNKVGMGIGINYVRRMLKAKYGERAKLEITSEMDIGTKVLLILPLDREE